MHTKISIRFCLVAACWVLFVKLTALAAPLQAEPKGAVSPAEKVRKALDQVVNIEFSEQPLQSALSQLTDQTKIKFVLDRISVATMAAGDPDMPVTAKLQDTKLRTGLRSVLSQYGLSFVVLEDSVLVTTQEMADYRQLQQRVDVEWQDVPLPQALTQLSRKTGCNLVLDRRISKESRETTLTLNMNDASLETVVRIMATEAGLTSVRMGNVLFVTTDEKAAKLRAEPESRPPGIGADGVGPGTVIPGIGVGPGAFLPPVRVMPAGAPPAPAPAVQPPPGVPVPPPVPEKQP
jgi:type II secretory pathway component HofQ